MRQKPKCRGIVLLRCPYCLESPLRKSGSWFEFADGCSGCHYRYEREAGYFWGAPWMISYPLVGIITLFVTSIFWSSLHARFGMLGLASLISLVAVTTAIGLYPYARAIWMVGDHILHPLHKDEQTYEVPS